MVLLVSGVVSLPPVYQEDRPFRRRSSTSPYYEDVVVGYWRTVKFSGALPAQRVNELLTRVERLQQAVKYAREEANNTEVTEQKVGARLLGYLFGA